MTKPTQTSRAISNTYKSNFNGNITQWSEARSSDEEDIGICKCRIKINAEITNEEVKVKSSEVEDIKVLKCTMKSHVDIINEVMKGRSSEEEYILIRNCRRRSRF